MAGAVILGFWGFQETVDANARWKMDTVWSNAFRTLQLLTSQFPSNLTTELPIQLQIARFAMPMFAVWFAMTALLRRFNRPLVAWAAGLSRHHVVLIGDSDVAAALARAYRKARRRVVAITSPPKGDDVVPMEATGAHVVFGDATKPAVLRRAAIHRASVAIVANDLESDAVVLATSVAALNRDLREPTADPLILLVRLGHRELRSLISTQIASAMRDSRVDLRLYIRERTIARSLLSRFPADWGLPRGPHDIHAAIIGLGDMGAELLLQLARIAVPTPGRRCVFTIVDRHADGLRDQLLAAHPGLANCAELRFLEAEVRPFAIKASEVKGWFDAPLAASAIYLCCGDDHANLSMAIGLRRAYARNNAPAPPLFVYQRTGNGLIEALPELHATAFDTLRIVPFGGIEDETDPFYLVDEEIDGLARLLHEEYLRSRQQMTAAGAPPAAVPWPELPDSYRTANRSQADHVLVKLRTLGWHAATEPAATATADAPSFDAAFLEQMSIQEHVRWCRERWLAGWTYDAKRNDAELHHPNLLPYAQLSEQVRDLDRKTVTQLPSLLAGLGIALQQDRILGIWFEGRYTTTSGVLTAKILDYATIDQSDAAPRRHLQLVLPLRHPGELPLASALARRGDGGVDVVVIRYAGAPGGTIGPGVSRSGARRVIAAADRAFTLTPAVPPGMSSDVAALAALCDVCDKILLACEEAQAGESILHQLDASRRARVEIVALQY